MLGRGPATPPDDIQQPLPAILLDHRRHPLRPLVIPAHDVGQSGIGVCRHGPFGHPPEPFDIGHHLPRPKGAVQPDAQQPPMLDRGIKRLDGLPRQQATAGIGDRAADHQRHGSIPEDRPQRVDGRLAVQGIENGLHQNRIHTAVHQPPHLLGIPLGQLVERDVPPPGVVHIGRNRGAPIGGPHRPGHEPRPTVSRLEPVGHAARQPSSRFVELVRARL